VAPADMLNSGCFSYGSRGLHMIANFHFQILRLAAFGKQLINPAKTKKQKNNCNAPGANSLCCRHQHPFQARCISKKGSSWIGMTIITMFEKKYKVDWTSIRLSQFIGMVSTRRYCVYRTSHYRSTMRVDRSARSFMEKRYICMISFSQTHESDFN